MQNKQPIQGTRTTDLTTEMVSTRLTKTDDDDFDLALLASKLKA